MKSGEFRKNRLCFVGSIVLSCCLLLCAFPTAARAESDAAETVRVSLSVGDIDRITVAVEGSYSCGGQDFVGGTLTATAQNGGVRLVHSELGELARGDSITVLRREHSVWAAFLTLDNTRYGSCRYLGDMIFANDGNDRLTVINRVDMRAYLYGVVGGELRNTHPAEALKAQAVAAKCFALTCLDTSSPYDLDDTPTDQVYKGYHPAHENVIAAVDAVADDLLLYEGDVVRCYYCTSNGGQTITPLMRWGNNSEQSEVFAMQYDFYDLEGAGDAVTLRVLPDAHLLPDAMQAYLLQIAQDANPAVTQLDTVVSLRGIHDRSDPDGSYDAPTALASQEWAEITLACRTADGMGITVACGFPLDALKSEHILSAPDANMQYIRPEDDGSWTIIFSRAIGHRVGMSHYGLLQCAELGFTYDEILYYYYPGAELVHGAKDMQPAAEARQAQPTQSPTPAAHRSETPAPAAPTATPELAFIPYEEAPSLWQRIFQSEF